MTAGTAPTLRKGFEPHLAVGGTTITARDVEMLRAIDRLGSMNRAAGELGRSYGHLQRRVVELEEAIGALTRRTKGGAAGGGTVLTSAGRELIRQFERLRAELAGVATFPESVVRGTVVERDGEIATVRTPAGDLRVRAPAAGDAVEIAVRSDAVVLMDPDAPEQARTSLRNRLPGTVTRIERAGAVATVAVAVAEETEIEAAVTRRSLSALDLAVGRRSVAAFKTTAARATPFYG